MIISILLLAFIVTWIIKDHKRAMIQLNASRQLGIDAEQLPNHGKTAV